MRILMTHKRFCWLVNLCWCHIHRSPPGMRLSSNRLLFNRFAPYSSNPLEPLSAEKYPYENSLSRHLHIHGKCGEQKLLADVKEVFLEDMAVLEDFVSEEEESRLMRDVEKSFRRKKYEYDHWDGAIYGFRETEKANWFPENESVIERIRACAFPEACVVLPAIHVLDLAKNGHINPHVDSKKFCGSTISGINLLSSAVMRFRRSAGDDAVIVDVKLLRRSLYIIRARVRHEFTHEILKESESRWRDELVPRDRRVSIIMRSPPS